MRVIAGQPVFRRADDLQYPLDDARKAIDSLPCVCARPDNLMTKVLGATGKLLETGKALSISTEPFLLKARVFCFVTV